MQKYEGIKLSEAREGTRYFVTKGSGCRSLVKGDTVWVERGDLMCKQSNGWLPKGEWERLRVYIVPINSFMNGAGI